MSLPEIDDHPDKPLWGAVPIADEIGKTVSQVYYLASKGLLDVDKVGRQLVSTRRRLRNQFAGARSSGPAAA